MTDLGKTWRLIYRIDADAIVILEVFAKKTSKTPSEVIYACRHVSFAVHATNRLEAIYEYISADSNENAARLITRIIDRAESLAEHPMRGRRVPEYLRDDI